MVPSNIYNHPKGISGAKPLTLQGHYAGFLSRTLALIIDYLVLAFALFIIGWFTSSLENLLLSLRLISIQWITDVYRLVSSLAFAILFIYMYFGFFWYLTGQTIGNAVMGIRVIRKDGSRVNLLYSLLRLVGYLISLVFFGIGFLWVLGEHKRRGWHDLIAGTIVIYAWEAIPDEQYLSMIEKSHRSLRFKKHLQLPSE